MEHRKFDLLKAFSLYDKRVWGVSVFACTGHLTPCPKSIPLVHRITHLCCAQFPMYASYIRSGSITRHTHGEVNDPRDGHFGRLLAQGGWGAYLLTWNLLGLHNHILIIVLVILHSFHDRENELGKIKTLHPAQIFYMCNNQHSLAQE